MIRKLLKTTLLTAIGCIASVGYAQETNSKFSYELLIGVHAPDLDHTIDGISNLGPIGNTSGFESFLPKAKQGINFGLRSNYNIVKNISAYGQLGYSSNGADNLDNLNSIITPFLGLLSLIDSPIDPESIRINIKDDGNYNLLSASIGARYDYLHKEKFNLGVYAGLSYYNLETAAVQADLSLDLGFLTFPFNNIIRIDSESDGAIGYQLGLNMTYNIDSKFYTGLNFEYNYAQFEYSEMRIQINEESLSDFVDLIPIDLALLQDIPVPSKIDLSSFKYGIVFGMRI